MKAVTRVQFNKGGYEGDDVEERLEFKSFTTKYMPFWWQLREVLRASDRASRYWKKSDGTGLSDSEQADLIALSLLNYAVYTGMAEALTFLDQMGNELGRTAPWGPTSGSVILSSSLYSRAATGTCSSYERQDASGQHSESPVMRLFMVRRAWKAMYSSLYTSFNALCNIVYIVVGHKPVFKRKGPVWNYSPKDAINLVEGRGLRKLADPLGRCKDHLEIRQHLDHYWLIWHNIVQGRFLLDKNFTKGYIPVHPETEVSLTIDARKQAKDDMEGLAKGFDLIYQELAVENGFLDQYLQDRGWSIDYSDYGPPHNGQRPLP